MGSGTPSVAADTQQKLSGDSGRLREDEDHLRALLFSRILVVEDDYVIASHMAGDLTRAGASQVDLVPGIEQAFAYLQNNAIRAAILDIDLGGNPVFPLADELLRRDVPFIFCTGYENILIPSRFSSTHRLRKPAEAKRMLDALQKTVAPELEWFSGTDDLELVAALPALRAYALRFAHDLEGADALVESALLRAIRAVNCRPAEIPIRDWLRALIELTAREKAH